MKRIGSPLFIGLVLLVGCSDDNQTGNSTDETPKNWNQPPKPMIDSHEYESLDAFLADAGSGFVILHQERAPGNDDYDAADAISLKLTERFEHFLGKLEPQLGKPDKRASEWDLGIPTFASGNGYALWNSDESFVSLFVSWDNPEDPSFVIAARAPLSSFDSSPEATDPWRSQWMEKGEW